MHFSITRVLAFCMILIITFVLTQASNAAVTPSPGSPEDPLITKSYVDAKVTTLNSKISALNKDLEAAEASLKATQATLKTAQTSIASANASIKTMKAQIATLIASGGSGSFEYKTVKKGATLLMKAGAMAVVYSGSAVVVGKLTDLSDGKALITGQIVVLRHLIASAITDTRGIKAKTDFTVLINK